MAKSIEPADRRPLVYGIFVLIIGTGTQVTTTNPALVAIRFDGIDEDVVGMVVVVDAEAAAHDAVLGDLTVEDDLDHDVQGHAGFLEGLHLGPDHRIADAAADAPAGHSPPGGSR